MNNPVLKKEIRTSMRSWKTAGIITVYAAILGAIPALFLIFTSLDTYRGYNLETLRGVFTIMVFFQLGLLSFVVPALTTNSISGEIQRGTIDLLICTNMTSLDIVLGKLMASLVKVVLLIVVSLPLFSVLSLFGGVDVITLLILMAYYMVVSVLYGSIGIFTSAFFKKNSVSTIISYIIILVLNVGTFVVATVATEIYSLKTTFTTDMFAKILYINPFSGLINVMDNLMGTGVNITRCSFTFTSYDTLLINMGINLILSVLIIKLTANKIDPMKKVSSFSNNKAAKVNKKVAAEVVEN